MGGGRDNGSEKDAIIGGGRLMGGLEYVRVYALLRPVYALFTRFRRKSENR